MMDKAWAFVGVTLAGTVFGQMLLKYAMDRHGQVPAGAKAIAAFLFRALLDPLVIASLALAFIAALAWMAAISRLELSVAYPFMALAFVFTTILSALILGEKVTVLRYAGAAVVVMGLVMVSKG